MMVCAQVTHLVTADGAGLLMRLINQQKPIVGASSDYIGDVLWILIYNNLKKL